MPDPPAPMVMPLQGTREYTGASGEAGNIGELHDPHLPMSFCVTLPDADEDDDQNDDEDERKEAHGHPFPVRWTWTRPTVGVSLPYGLHTSEAAQALVRCS